MSTEEVFRIDVFFSESFPVGPEPDGFRRFVISAKDVTEARLIACQMTASHGGRTPVGDTVLF